jgi:hypothetical protein
MSTTSQPTETDRIARKDHPDRIALANSTITFETGPAGTVARVDRPDGTEYAGPLPEGTIAALREVGDDV